MKVVLKRKTKSFSFSAVAGIGGSTIGAIGKFTPASTIIKGVKISEKRVGSALQNYAAKRAN